MAVLRASTAPPDITSMGRDGGDPIGLDEKRLAPAGEADANGIRSFNIARQGNRCRVLVVKDDVDESVDIGDVHLVVAVHIGSS